MQQPNHSSIPFERVACDVIADFILTSTTQAPDLTEHQLVIAEPRLALPLQRALLTTAQHRGHHALLGPTIVTFDHWLRAFVPPQQLLCDEQSRILILVEALQQFPQLLRDANVWSLAEDLLQLFDELTLNNLHLPANQSEFTALLARGYRLKTKNHAALTHEATLVSTLWQAWHKQLQANHWIDASMARVMAMQNSVQQPLRHPTHFIGITALYRSERQWFDAVMRDPLSRFWQYGQGYNVARPNLIDHALMAATNPSQVVTAVTHDLPNYTAVLQRIFDPDAAPLQERALQCRHDYPNNPVAPHLRTFAAADAEQEAQAVDLQVRRWLWQGKQRIAIVTENRRLARRIRALLERADVILQDSAGWALSTTRAAAAIEALLECLEEDFAHIPLLDLFKSDFIFADEDAHQVKNATYHLERDIIRHEGIARGIHRYQDFIRDRQERLAQLWPAEQPSRLLTLLQRLDHATATMRELTLGKHEARTYIATLLTTFDHLAMTAALRDDAAGECLLQSLAQMHLAAQQQQMSLSWLDFRTWLGRVFETVYFRPHENHGAVQLLNLSQAQWQHFDAVILAGAEHDQLPGSAYASPYFNDGVRRELELPTRQIAYQHRLLQFFRLMHSAPSLLVTWRNEAHGEWINKTAWVEAIESFIHEAYHSSLRDQELAALVVDPRSQVNRCDTHDLPNIQVPPRPQIHAPHLPHTLSFSDLQKLVDCPYHFFAARILKLTPPEEVQLVLSKRDYGQRVHQCLQAFHGRVPNLPGPFRQPITAATRDAAITLLEAISAEVFAQDLADNFTHRGWYHEWRDCIPAYIDWQMRREEHWRCKQLEWHTEVPFTSELALKGQLDRLDENTEGMAIVDYKTGHIPSQKDVLGGEAIQLPFYALLLQQASMPPAVLAEYLELKSPIRSKVVIDQPTLLPLRDQLRQRLNDTLAALTQQQPLPAWPHEKVCQYCPMETLCRKQMWQDTAECSTSIN